MPGASLPARAAPLASREKGLSTPIHAPGTPAPPAPTFIPLPWIPALHSSFLESGSGFGQEGRRELALALALESAQPHHQLEGGHSKPRHSLKGPER